MGASAQRDGAVCLAFKNKLHEEWVGALVSLDDARCFSGTPYLILPASWDGLRLTHNLAILRDLNLSDARAPASYLIIGGRYSRESYNFGMQGLWVARSATWTFYPQSNVAAAGARHALQGCRRGA